MWAAYGPPRRSRCSRTATSRGARPGGNTAASSTRRSKSGAKGVLDMTGSVLHCCNSDTSASAHRTRSTERLSPMAHYQAVGSIPPKRHTQHRRPGRARRRASSTTRSSWRGGLQLRQLAALPPQHPVDDDRRRGVGAARPVDDAEPPADPTPPQAARPLRRRLRRADRRRERSPPRPRQQRRSHLVCRLPAQASPWYRNGIGDECVYVERGAARVETVFGAFEVGRATTSSSPERRRTAGSPLPPTTSRCAPTASRPTATSPLPSATSAGTASSSSTRPTASATCASPRGRSSPRTSEPARRADRRLHQAPRQRPRRRRRHDPHAALPPARRRRLGRLPLPVRLQRA